MDNSGIKAGNPAAGKKIVLAGNPNVGKSALFNILTGLYVDVSNYPGTTLDMTCGRYNGDVIIEAPGVYGLSSMNDEEKITRDIILAADVVVNVVNSLHLDRDLFFTLQIIDMGIPIVVALNMTDEAMQVGLEININLLEKLLGVPVVPIAAVSGAGIEELKDKIYSARTGHVNLALMEKMKMLLSKMNRREALLVIEGDAKLSECYGVQPGTEREAIYRARRENVNRIVAQVVREINKDASIAARLGNWMLLPVTGFPLLALTLWAVYELVGVFLAQFVVDLTGGFMSGYYEPAVRSLLSGVISPEGVIYSILAGQYGLLTLTVTYLIGLLFPLVLGIFFVLSILEDSGYMPRIATLLDRTLTGIGLNGQAVIPLLLGFGCVTMACITTRILGSDRERRIAIFLLALGVPCSAQMAIITAVLAGSGVSYMLLYMLFMLFMIVGAGTLLGRFLPGRPFPLLIELPPLRLPGAKNVWKKTWGRSYQFIKEAFPIFAGGTLLLGILDVYGVLHQLRYLLAPVTVSWLHLPEEVADIFIMGFIRKEFGAAAVLNLQMLPLQKFVVMLTLSLTVPCIASTMVIFKERGWREGLLIWAAVFATAFIAGGLATRLLEIWLV
ncbi:ferrous iron transport protein B [Pelotomaculum isophthalicicum JI]|uniref:Ferrous iron transport protein B n=1 Tax=Pelotomaculum isophthalicicum JI TaxID=947010 RepID=A0A9X4H877_9FIRM|nr:ferrous iron transport protein B [Pelotomaculum isophthalicicum]MDF9408629.1 ferrous iron transport protein B [Pelotomaculum isophthalicicum JI]